jgi:heme A synthase
VSVLNNPPTIYRSRLHGYALLTAGCTFILLLAGALVTSTGSSLAVPDWPLSFGKFFPEMKGGVLFEHGHRMVAGTVALLTLGLAVYTQLVEKRSWVKKLAWCALGAVLLQAVLGGVTVLLHLPTEVSVAHAGLAQIFFCLIISLSLVTSKNWIENWDRKIKSTTGSIRTAALTTTIIIYFQILIGRGITRHSGFGWPYRIGRYRSVSWCPMNGLGPFCFNSAILGSGRSLFWFSSTGFALRFAPNIPMKRLSFGRRPARRCSSGFSVS